MRMEFFSWIFRVRNRIEDWVIIGTRPFHLQPDTMPITIIWLHRMGMGKSMVMVMSQMETEKLMPIAGSLTAQQRLKITNKSCKMVLATEVAVPVILCIVWIGFRNYILHFCRVYTYLPISDIIPCNPEAGTELAWLGLEYRGDTWWGFPLYVTWHVSRGTTVRPLSGTLSLYCGTVWWLWKWKLRQANNTQNQMQTLKVKVL